MKQVTYVEEIYISPDGKDNIYLTEDGLHVREVEMDLGLGEEIVIGHMSDLHFNYCNEQDFAEAEPVIMSTYENRIWLANAASVPNAQRCFAFLDDVDQLVINGDTLDYLSHGAMELMQREVWDKHPDVIATLGGHEAARQMQGKIPDPMPREKRLEILKDFWKHDIYYTSKVIREKVMIVGMCDDIACFNEQQKQQLEADLRRARENGYVVLIFAHEPFATKNPKHCNVTAEDAILLRDASGFPKDFCTGISRGGKIVGNDECDAVTKEVYRIITNSADVIKGVFTGHFHSDLHLEIVAKTPAGENVSIPQYVHTATAYDAGHCMRIRIK